MLLDIDYNSKENRIYIYTTKKIIKKDFKPYLYIDADKNTINKFIDEEEPQLKEYITAIERVKKIIINLNDIENPYKNRTVEKTLSKITTDHPKDIPKLRKLQKIKANQRLANFPNGKIGTTYEHDIPFTKRYLIDNNKNIDLLNYNNIPDLKAVSFDMEVHFKDREPEPEKDAILMTSFYSHDKKINKKIKKVITYKPFEHESVEIVKDEKELIKKTMELLKQYNIIYTYNGDNFDFPYLKRRAEHLKIPLNFGENHKLKLSKGGMNLKSAISGIVHIDLYPIARRTLNLTKYKLEDVSKELFNIEKLEVGHHNIVPLWNNNNPKLVEYSLQDAEYTYKIGEYFLPLEIMFSNIVGQCLFDISRMSSSNMVEYLLLKHSFNKNYLAPNRPYGNEYQNRLKEGYEGGYVKEPIKGMHDNIVSMDFRALYPSIIISYNISPDTINCPCCGDTNDKILGYWFCKKKIGIIPEILKDLIERRKNIKDVLKNKNTTENNKDDNNKNNNENYKLLNYEQQSIKILANSFYGYMAYPRARWYSKECAEVITHLGRAYIRKTIEEAENNGFNVIYADTDGLYAILDENKNKNTNKENILNKTIKFLNEINRELPEKMELEFEGYYKRGIFITKKRYALIDENNKIIVKGLEFVRRDWSNIAKKTQKKVLNTLLKEGDVETAKQIIKDTINDLKNLPQSKIGESPGGDKKINPKDLIIYKQLTKDISEYSTATPHIAVAKKMRDRGDRLKIGDVIGFVIVNGSSPISERATIPEQATNYDANYYIDNQVLPPVLRIMEAIGITKDELKNNNKQITLDNFF
ncbi:DNA polymerase Pol2 [Methanococcus aeolicus Nankai-3]|uniref:DNA polymerase n=1 Tax=Methanococcus aeolicus (strain ATCC BAA-1280 / DSM 17508 / OCM 812 / Nankai-3) TaxID=419665 RepID=A6UUR5_META3|nr:DNA-directed DNA polymerase [Methanococcus aeolicus]ABR56237.1 DNA polymerase Pol2 [Methanococcus aeolicus Nankai-3]